MKQISTLILLLVFCSLGAWATHNRAGEITYVHRPDLSQLTFEFTITTYTDPASPADRDSLTIFWGDGLESFEVLVRSSFVDTITDYIRKNEYVGIHTYPGVGTYVVSMQDPNRVEGIVNINGSVNVPFFIEDTLRMPDPLFYGYNSSPVLINPPIDFANVGEVFIHNPNAFDPDGDSLSYQFIIPKQATILDVPGYEYPNDFDACGASFTINELTGEVRWETPCQEGIYNIAILITEFREGIKVGSMIRDMQIIVVQTPNNPPEIAEVKDTCIVAGEVLTINVTATDPDIGDVITLTADGGPFNVNNNPASFPVASGFSPVTGNFNWNTNCSHIRKSFYQVVFRAEDDYTLGSESLPLVDLESWLITVVAPPPENLIATPIGNRIELRWDSLYSCFNTENFRGFSVWRKLGCDSTEEFDKCLRGLGGTGYFKIAELEDAHSYTDFDVVRGPQYAYRVVAEFAESAPPPSPFVYNEVSGRPSNLACAELKRDVPIITNVSVRNTDETAGSMFIAWARPNPDDLDTLQNPGPYKYELFRDQGFSASAPTLIASFNSANFASYKDTTYIDTLLNTVLNPYNYFVKLFVSDGGGGFLEIGETVNASSIYLSIGFADNELNLSWEENVPWFNFEYEVLKENPTGSGNFELLASVSESSFTDENLNNETLYCYQIKGLGTYGAVGFPDTLINFSQVRCETPKDTVAACAPTLAIQNICDQGENIPFVAEDLKNDLSWNNPNEFCADDVVKYYIYYASPGSSDFILLDSTNSDMDTTYSHDELNSLAGCYAVTAIDSFDNESDFSNIVCVDNCPNYNLPNVFTPNGDGQNDLFTPFLPFRFVESIDIKIFNRWGGLVFETKDPMINWDGKDINSGKDLSEGVYYYVCSVFEIRVEGTVPRNTPLSGYIHLIRGNGKSN